jgi:hypothetical protein
MNLERFMLPCFSKTLFGVDCPGCGLQRSIVLLFEGNFIAAFKMYPAVFTTILFFVVVGLHFIDKSRNYHRIIVWSAIFNGVIMIVAYFFKLFN